MFAPHPEKIFKYPIVGKIIYWICIITFVYFGLLNVIIGIIDQDLIIGSFGLILLIFCSYIVKQLWNSRK